MANYRSGLRSWGITFGVAGMAALAGMPARVAAQETPVRLPPPAWGYSYRPAGKPGKQAPPRVRLTKLSERTNGITDEERWFQANGVSLPLAYDGRPDRPKAPLPDGVPESYQGQQLLRAIRDGALLLLLYGEDFSGARYVLVFDTAADEVRHAFDFASYIVPPRLVAKDREFVDEPVQWALVRNGVLYVSNFHRTYARSSKGLNGYLTAINLADGKVRWRSRALVCNSQNFLITNGVLLTGYGFSAEPDFLYALDTRTGSLLKTVPLKSGPEVLFLKGDRLYVRTYNTDYQFRLAR